MEAWGAEQHCAASRILGAEGRVIDMADVSLVVRLAADASTGHAASQPCLAHRRLPDLAISDQAHCTLMLVSSARVLPLFRLAVEANSTPLGPLPAGADTQTPKDRYTQAQGP